MFVCTAHAEETPDEIIDKPAAKQVELPGIKIDAKNKWVDVDAKVAMTEGLLEVIACIEDTREHESILIVDAVPLHIHTALLLIGAESGRPAMVKPVNEEKTQWLRLPPRGDPIAVSLIYPDPDDKDKALERPISDFLKRSESGPAGDDAEKQAAEDPAEVFDTFVFAGSILRESENDEREYLADVNGNVVSISTFGDEVLCLPAQISQDNAALVWSIDDTHLPAKGTKVKLRLTLKKQEEKNEAE